MKAKKSLKKFIPRGSAFCDDDNDNGESIKSPMAIRKGPGSISKVKNRKELRKELRKAKKAQKHQYLLVKCGRADLVQKAADEIEGKKKRKKKKKKKKKKVFSEIISKIQKQTGKESDDEDEEDKVEEIDEDAEFVKNVVSQKGQARLDPALELRMEEDKYKRSIEMVRRKRLLEENEEEDKTINKLSKMLKLNKKATIPASFRTDGLDYLLEKCEQTIGAKKKKKNSTDDDDDDEEVDMEENASDLDSMDQGSEEGEDVSDEFDMDDEEELDPEELDDDSLSENEDVDDDHEEEEAAQESDEEEGENFDQEKVDNLEDDSASEKSEDIVKPMKKKKAEAKLKPKKDDGVWEDIYGRLRAKDGSVINKDGTEESKPVAKSISSSGKYVPPMLRGNQAQREKLTKQLKGLLNRLSESNMHSIANQIEEMYMTNSRNEMNETLLKLLNVALIGSTLMPERVVMEHVMLIAILHANIGTEIGAFFIQSYVNDFKSKYDDLDATKDSDDKYLENTIQVVSCIYHFKIVDACLMYDILKFLSDSFAPKDVELILTILRSVGFRLRKDDPVALKELIFTIQQKASKSQQGTSSSTKVKFMMEILLAIRNNNMNKIPNYDPSFGEHLMKALKTHLRPGNYVSELKIGLKDLLNADNAGRWWIVGSAWTGKQSENDSNNPNPADTLITSEDAIKHAKLLKRARAQGMNTDTRRNIFCILMTAEDYMDAFEKLNHLDLRNNQDREIVHVTLYCCLQEKQFNPYYALIASKFSSMDRKLMYPLKFKAEVCQYAERLGQRAASRLLCVSQKRIFDWVTEAKGRPDSISRRRSVILQCRRKNLSKIRKSLALYSGPTQMNNFQVLPSASIVSKELDAKVESIVQDWIQSCHPKIPQSTEIREKAKEVYRHHGRDDIHCSYGWYRRFMARLKTKGVKASNIHEEEDIHILPWLLKAYDNNDLVSQKELRAFSQNSFKEVKPDFKASAGWALRFLKRNQLLISSEEFYDQPLPAILETHVDIFRSDVRNMFNQFPLQSFGCVDEIPISFSTSSKSLDNRTMDVSSSRLKKISIKNCEATIMLSLLADGTLLPPFVIVKGELPISINQIYTTPRSRVVTYYSSSTEPTLECLEKWMELIWGTTYFDNTPRVLIADSYEAHLQLEQICNNYNTMFKVIPSGCSLRLQPLNVFVKNMFLKNMNAFWVQYLKPNEEQKVEQMRLPSTNEVIEWVHKSHQKVMNCQDQLRESFQRIYGWRDN